jgi:hypothetical protein
VDAIRLSNLKLEIGEDNSPRKRAALAASAARSKERAKDVLSGKKYKERITLILNEQYEEHVKNTHCG